MDPRSSGTGGVAAGIGQRARRFALVAGLMLTAGAPLGAQSVCPTTGTLADLIAFGSIGCTVHDKVFSDFTTTITSTGFTTALTAAQIGYTVINPDAISHGFLFSAPWNAPAGGTLDQSLGYRVRTVDGSARISDVHLSEFGEDVFGAPPPTGYVSIAEDVCAGALWFPSFCAGGTTHSLSTFYSENPALYGPGNHTAAAAWSPFVSVIDVQKDIQVFGGNGGATFSLMDQFVTQTPEPGTIALLATGLVAVGTMARRRRLI